MSRIGKLVTLENGVKMPRIGMGTWLHNNLRETVETGLAHGYRYIDTGRVYGNEKLVGQIVKEHIDRGEFKREEVFIGTKMWNNKNLKVVS